MSAIVRSALRTWRACRDEYETYREYAFGRAHEECSGVLLNARGKRAGVDPWSLFIGSDARAYAYASEELIEFWGRYPRVTFEQFERTWFNGNGEEDV